MNRSYCPFIRKLVRISIQLLISIVICCPVGLGKYSGGKGEPNEPYLISTPNDLNSIGLDSNDWDKHFLMTADINMTDYTGTQFNIIGNDIIPFLGTFDGNNHTIYNFTIETNGSGNVSLFSEVVGLVKNLGMADPCINAPNSVAGSLVGELLPYGQVVSCRVDGGTIDCLDGGGLIGRTEGQILQCYSKCNVSGKDVGGLTGILYKGTISQCFSDSSVSGTNYVGGLVGYAAGSTTINCYATGRVTGGNYAGGLIGIIPYLGSGVPATYVDNCYSATSINGGTSKGGLIASTDWMYDILWCFWDVQASGEPNSAGGTGKDTNQMMSESTFFIWACQQCWTIDDGNDYPRLSWENRPGHPITKTAYQSGTGTNEDPYLIYNAPQLRNISLNPCDWEKHFKLMADIDLSGLPEGTFNAIGYNDRYYFQGVFDGNNHSISNLTYSRPYQYSALFGYVSGPNAEIKNLTLIDPNIQCTQHYTGALVGLLYNGTILNCHTLGGSVSGSIGVGGLVGYIQEGVIENSSSSAWVVGTSYVGGLVGRGAKIYNSFASGNVSGQDNVGGLSGMYSRIVNCYASGNVDGQDKVGGLIGYLNSSVYNSYSVGHVTGTTNVGGIIGYVYNNRAEVRSSYWDINTSGCSQSAGGTPKSTELMKSADTYLGWGCEGVWTIDEPNDYPHLWWEKQPGQPIEKYLYFGGNGEPGTPYIINTADDFLMIALNFCDWDSHFRLNTDLDLSGTEPFKIGVSDHPFSGAFDGNNFTISNFSYNVRTYTNNEGLFGIVDGEDTEIRNLKLLNPYVYGTNSDSDNVAILVGHLKGGTISNCQIINGYVNCDDWAFEYVGGLAGRTDTGTLITNCIVDCDVKGYRNVGGFVGYNYAEIYDSHWTGSVSHIYRDAGGFVYSNNGTIARCSATGQVYGDGGFADSSGGTIDRCYADVTLTNDNEYNVGGLVGYIGNGKVSNCYAKGSVQGGTRVGGLVGYVYRGNIENCHCLIQVSGNQYVGSAIGDVGAEGSVTSCFWDNTIDNHDNGFGTGLPTSLLQIKSTFTDDGWKFVEQTKDTVMNPWRMCTDDTDYPGLSWQSPPADSLCPDRIDLLDYAILSDQWMLRRLTKDVVPDGGDYLVNFMDWAAFALNWNFEQRYTALNDFLDEWLSKGIYNADIAPVGGDDIIDLHDLKLLCENWLEE